MLPTTQPSGGDPQRQRQVAAEIGQGPYGVGFLAGPFLAERRRHEREGVLGRKHAQ
ncbi:hypothetical protein OG730_27155 [Streptomyces sp. NBC_01298]|nr:hypothetical protein OG730_27155 [Streptomyces sp. NBC_01298]